MDTPSVCENPQDESTSAEESESTAQPTLHDLVSLIESGQREEIALLKEILAAIRANPQGIAGAPLSGAVTCPMCGGTEVGKKSCGTCLGTGTLDAR